MDDQHPPDRFLSLSQRVDVGTLEKWLPFRWYDYNDYYKHQLSPEQLQDLLEAAAGCAKPSGAAIQPDRSDLSLLPPDLVDFMSTMETIPHASEVPLEPPETVIERPKIPNRYKMEEDYKQLLARRRRSRSITLEDAV